MPRTVQPPSRLLRAARGLPLPTPTRSVSDFVRHRPRAAAVPADP
jgi:hypothetical protein